MTMELKEIHELYEHLPEELVWHVLKFTRHPCAEIMRECFPCKYETCACYNNVIFIESGLWCLSNTYGLICGSCYEINKDEIQSANEQLYAEYLNEEGRYEEYLDEQRVDNYDYYNLHRDEYTEFTDSDSD